MLMSSISLSAQKDLPAISDSLKDRFFIPEDILKNNYKLRADQQNDWTKAYYNDSKTALFYSLEDIRWQAKDKESASNWFHANTEYLSDGLKDITIQMSKPAGVNDWNIYSADEKLTEMSKKMGIKERMYYFTFTVYKYVAKISIITSSAVSLQEAWKLAKEGLKAILQASGDFNFLLY